MEQSFLYALIVLQFASSSWKPEPKKTSPVVKNILSSTSPPQIIRRSTQLPMINEPELVEDYSPKSQKRKRATKFNP